MLLKWSQQSKGAKMIKFAGKKEKHYTNLAKCNNDFQGACAWKERTYSIQFKEEIRKTQE